MSVKITVPSAGESVNEGEISKWYKENQSQVEKDEVIAELETEKASLEIRSPESGVLFIKEKEGSTVEVGQIIAEIEIRKEPKKESKEVDKEKIEDHFSPSKLEEDLTFSSQKVHASPSVRNVIREKNIDPDSISPTGKGGRITQQDLKTTNQMNGAEVRDHHQMGINNQLSEHREVWREKMSRIRKTIARRLLETKNTTALLTTFNEINMDQVIKIKKKYKEELKEKHGVGLGFNSFFIKAASLALKAFPIVNSIVEGEEIVFHNYEDIGIAVATPKGLVVPIIRDVGKKGFVEIERNILDFALRGKENKINLDEMTGGTFSITNGGIFGSLLSTPIVNAPQSAILGLHNIVERPVVIKGEVVIQPIMYVALSYDHRHIDGAQAVQFLVHIKESIEDPAKLMLGL